MIRFINFDNVVTDSNYRTYKEIHASDTKLLVISGGFESFEELETYYLKRLSESKEDIEWSDKIILECRWEALHHDVWEKCIEYLKPKEVLTIDGSLIPSTKYNNIIDRVFFMRNKDIVPKPFSQRNKLYQSLSRVAACKFQRVELTYRLYKRNLLDKGIVSCMSNPDERNYRLDIAHMGTEWEQDFLDILPMTYDGFVDSHYASFQSVVGDNVRVNVVNESSFDITESTLFEGIRYNGGRFWTRPFMTEKSVKAFRLHQLPLFVTAGGYVEELRKLGFDLYDDIINHSYDLEKDPTKRINMVVEELYRLSLIEDKLLSKEGLWERMEHNVKRLEVLYNENRIFVDDYINKWFFSDSKYSNHNSHSLI